MANTLYMFPPQVRMYRVGERGPELFVTRDGCNFVPESLGHRMHDGAWFAREGERAAARATWRAGIALVLLLVAAWVLA